MSKEPPAYNPVDPKESSTTLGDPQQSYPPPSPSYGQPYPNPYGYNSVPQNPYSQPPQNPYTAPYNNTQSPYQQPVYPPATDMQTNQINVLLQAKAQSMQRTKDLCRPLRYVVLVFAVLGVIGGIAGGITMIIMSPTHLFVPAAQRADYAIVAQFAKVSVISQFSYFSIASQVSICSVFSMVSVCSFASMGALLSGYSMFSAISVFISCFTCYNVKDHDE